MSSEFQNRVRKNMGQNAPAEHPAADVLNAYAEHALTNAEEAQVLEHLSVCAECRETLYLASEALEEPAKQLPAPVATRRLRWWTWAIPAAAVIVVASLVAILQSSHVSSPKKAAQIATSIQPELETNKQKTAPAPPAPPAPEKSSGITTYTAKVAPSKTSNAPSAATRENVAGGVRDKVKRKETNDELSAHGEQTIAADNAAPAMAPSPNLAGGAVAARSFTAAVPTAPPQAGASRGASETVEVTSEAPLLEAQPAGQQQTQATQLGLRSKAQYSQSTNGVVSLNRLKPSPTWTVTTKGTLEHFVGGAWLPAYPEANTQFLSVSNVGNDVWAGGKKLLLYHSGDNGQHWEQQTLPAQQPSDIIHIEFNNALEGAVKTSSGGQFVTRDGGKTWIGVDAPNPKP